MVAGVAGGEGGCGGGGGRSGLILDLSEGEVKSIWRGGGVGEEGGKQGCPAAEGGGAQGSGRSGLRLGHTVLGPKLQAGPGGGASGEAGEGGVPAGKQPFPQGARVGSASRGPSHGATDSSQAPSLACKLRLVVTWACSRPPADGQAPFDDLFLR